MCICFGPTFFINFFILFQNKDACLDTYFIFHQEIINTQSKMLNACGSFLLIPYYEKYFINIKLETKINYRGFERINMKNISNY